MGVAEIHVLDVDGNELAVLGPTEGLHEYSGAVTRSGTVYDITLDDFCLPVSHVGQHLVAGDTVSYILGDLFDHT
jgi:hypothetical protein